jgi:Zn-dependent protease/predicted transcriptional regulator
MRSSFKLGRIAGIDIGIHYTWLFAFLLISWSLAEGFFPSTFTGYGTTAYWLLGIAGAIGLFGSVLFHELSHSLVARVRGMTVSSITLFIFGGVSNLKGEPKSALDEFLVASVGPLSSFLLAAVFWPLSQNLSPETNPVGALLAYLAFVNLMLGAFNLVPGFPLDGGRVLRSILWAVTGRMDRATQIASYAGQAVGLLLVFWGVSRVLGGDFLGGLWTAFIGWFLNNAAESTRQDQAVERTLAGVRVSQVMDPSPLIIDPGLSVDQFVFAHVLGQGRRAALVEASGKLLGIVSITDARHVPQSAWSTTPVADIMTHAPLRTVRPAARVADALQHLTENEINQVPVVDEGAIVGMLSRADILRLLQLRNEVGVDSRSEASFREVAA